MIGLFLLTAGGLLSLAHPTRRHLAWVRWSAELRSAYPIAAPEPSLDRLMEQAGEALDRQP